MDIKKGNFVKCKNSHPLAPVRSNGPAGHFVEENETYETIETDEEKNQVLLRLGHKVTGWFYAERLELVW